MLLTIETTDGRKFTHCLEFTSMDEILGRMSAPNTKFVVLEENGMLFLYIVNNIVRMYAIMEDG